MVYDPGCACDECTETSRNALPETMTPDKPESEPDLCHCGRPVFVHESFSAPGVGFSRGTCEECDANRCDTSDGMADGCPHAADRGVSELMVLRLRVAQLENRIEAAINDCETVYLRQQGITDVPMISASHVLDILTKAVS